LGKDKYVVQSLAICRDTNCPAVLVENLFQDNKEDVAYLLSAEGKNTLLGVMYNGIVDYINTFEK
jgi:N-acetylmuramoyl-L-alanine amidase